MKGWCGMTDKKDQYGELGVDSDKRNLEKAFGKSNKKLFPNAFCVINYNEDLGIYEIMHADGSGSKSILRWLCFLETGDPKFLEWDLFDAFTMNSGDAATCGFIDSFKSINITAINKQNVDKQVFIEALAKAERELRLLYASYGMHYLSMGGEVADLPDQVGSHVLDVAVYTYLKDKKRIIQGNVEPGDNIWGFFSNGQAVWEDEINSGVMANGQTMGRIKLIHKDYAAKYPFLTRESNPFEGRFHIDDRISSIDMTVSEALLSPTRQWAILIKMLIEELESSGNLDLLHGISMNTGGGATKIRNIGQGICYHKMMPEPPKIFQLIQDESGEKWKNMFTTFNCGIGIDVVGSDAGGILGMAIRKVSEKSGVNFIHLGDCTQNKSAENVVRLDTLFGKFVYE